MKTFIIICGHKIVGRCLCELVGSKWCVRSGHIAGKLKGKLEFVQAS